ncbi:hypothetical protein J6590_101063 [Homalodisca vitripennis]|nr:hypothetical protein J6590_101063 [Homalodisca vitripennis]
MAFYTKGAPPTSIVTLLVNRRMDPPFDPNISIFAVSDEPLLDIRWAAQMECQTENIHQEGISSIVLDKVAPVPRCVGSARLLEENYTSHLVHPTVLSDVLQILLPTLISSVKQKTFIRRVSRPLSWAKSLQFHVVWEALGYWKS